MNIAGTKNVHGQIKSSNTSLQSIELNPSCSRQAHFNRSGAGYGYESKELGCMPG